MFSYFIMCLFHNLSLFLYLYFHFHVFILLFFLIVFLNHFWDPRPKLRPKAHFCLPNPGPTPVHFLQAQLQQAQKGPFSSGPQTWPKARSQRPYQNGLQITRPTWVASSPSRTRARPSMDPLLCDSASPAWHADVFPLPPTNSQATHAKVCCV